MVAEAMSTTRSRVGVAVLNGMSIYISHSDSGKKSKLKIIT
jgi:hypothetical protein